MTDPDAINDVEDDETTSAATATADASVQADVPSFGELTPEGGGDAEERLDPFLQVTVDVWAELGRVTMPLGELLRMGAGSVIKLDRPVSAPVDLMAQGVCFARGEVVIVDDCFAIRIKEIENARSKATLLAK